MTQERLLDLAMISIEYEISEKMDFTETIDKFASQKARKAQLKIFAASGSKFFWEIWLEEIIWTPSHLLRRIGKLEERRSLTNIAEEYQINKNVISRARKASETIGTTVKKVGGDRSRKISTVDDKYIFLQEKRVQYQSVSALLSKCVQQQGNKCRGLLWRPDAFTNVAYSPAVLNAVSL
ncbi:hypothetical protein TNCV_1997481 [Trichonephila clavipes]|uniref:Uncharacterized protein n=1 Tax=Trichonephila clavipes TaxID=2585209 RepID=A0A8X6RKG1_TRICX|nr:hypothetical protein TNCV_1997481 [Trichonephila clavipes]